MKTIEPSKAKKPKKTARKPPARRGKPSGRQAVKKGDGGMDLLRIADRVGLQQYAAEGFRDRYDIAVAILAGSDGPPTNEDMKKHPFIMAQYVRERGGMAPDEIFAAMDSFAEEIALEDRELNRLYKASEAKHDEAGYGEDESWPEDQRPADVQRLFDAYWDRMAQLKISILRHHAENEMADLLLNDPAAYAERVEKGKTLYEGNHAVRMAAMKAKNEKAD